MRMVLQLPFLLVLMLVTGGVRVACKRTEGLFEGWSRSIHDKAQTDLMVSYSWQLFQTVYFKVWGCSLALPHSN